MQARVPQRKSSHKPPIQLDIHCQSDLYTRGECRVADVSLLSSLFLHWDMLTESRARKFCSKKQFLLTPRSAIFVDNYLSPLIATGITPKDALTVMIPLNQSGSSRYKRKPMQAGECIVSCGGVIDNVFEPGDQILFVRLKHALLPPTLLQTLGLSTRDNSRVLRPELERRNFAAQVCGLLTFLSNSDGLSQVQHPNQLKALELDLRDRVLALILSAQGHSKLSLSARQAVFYQAVEHILARQDDLSLSMPDLAEQVNVSLRTLEYAFHDTTGHPPRAFIRQLRLQGLRRELLLNRNCRSVTDAAARAGFVELGRMANDYKKTFGELPSQTLARAITVQLPGSIERTLSS